VILISSPVNHKNSNSSTWFDCRKLRFLRRSRSILDRYIRSQIGVFITLTDIPIWTNLYSIPTRLIRREGTWKSAAMLTVWLSSFKMISVDYIKSAESPRGARGQLNCVIRWPHSVADAVSPPCYSHHRLISFSFFRHLRGSFRRSQQCCGYLMLLRSAGDSVYSSKLGHALCQVTLQQ